jgi:quercetin dioxygenase-like cupin family protein
VTGLRPATAIWFAGTLATIRGTSEQTDGRLAVVEFLCPTGFATPRHVHRVEDEAFVVLEGSVAGFCGDEAWSAEPGSFVWLPRDVAHGFEVVGRDPARLLAITLPGGFDRFVTDAGEPAVRRTLPPPREVDIPKLLAAAVRHGQEILPPSTE